MHANKNSDTIYTFFLLIMLTALTYFKLITVDLGVARQRPCRAVKAASWEHPVLNDKNIRCDRWLINHGGTHAVSTGGLRLENARWAGGHGQHQLTHDTGISDTLYWLPGVTEGDLGGKSIYNGQVSTVHKDSFSSAAQSIPVMLELKGSGFWS